jgi:hypothetical protein
LQIVYAVLDVQLLFIHLAYLLIQGIRYQPYGIRRLVGIGDLLPGFQFPARSRLIGGQGLLKRFKEVELLSPEDKYLVKTFIAAFITKRHVQQRAK